VSDEILLPDVFDVSDESAAEADAALDPQPTPPADCAIATDKNGNKYERWTEIVNIEKTSMSRSPKGHTMFLIEAKIRPSGKPGQKNVGKRIYTRLTVNFPTMQAQRLGQEFDNSMAQMNTRSLGTLNSLLRCTGYYPTTGAPTAALLKMLFPLADAPVNTSPLQGKVVTCNVVRSKSRGTSKYPFDVRGESFTPVPTA